MANVVRGVNWMEQARNLIEANCPVARGNSPIIAEKLAALLLERLPAEVSRSLVALLPPQVDHAFVPSLESEGDASIGYPDFVERATQYCQCNDEDARRIADTFLWSVTQEIPPDLKTRMMKILPTELRSRMNLYLASSEEAKVA